VHDAILALAVLAAPAPPGVLLGSYVTGPSPRNPKFQFELRCELRTLDPRDGRQTRLRAAKGKNECPSNPQLTPDGAKVAFTLAMPGKAQTRRSLRILDVAHHTEKTLATLDHHGYRYSPDGALLLIVGWWYRR
jgi:hypothetical protein